MKEYKLKLPNINKYKTQDKFEEALCKYMDKVKKHKQFLKHTLTLDMFIGDKALFEGFYLNDGYVCFKDGFIDVVEDIELYTIEDLLEYELTLTPYAIKLLRL